jgi:putative DNA primase/helicase
MNGTNPWPEPTPLPDGLPPVATFDYELLPVVLRTRVEDIAERMQCPPDFPAVAVMVMLSSLVGRRCGIAPKRADDWIVVPNLWGMAIGRPGIMKSPPLAEVMRPLQVLQARASDVYELNRVNHQAGIMVAAESERVAKDAIRKMIREGKTTAAEERAQEAVDRDTSEPICRRYVVNDSTVEKLGEILNENPFGILLFRDELNGFFRTLDRQGHEADRAFYLECWNGDGSFTYDRIGRGTLHIAGACLSVLGSIQPGPLADLVRGLRGSGDDGLLQRFQLAVWPDVRPDWRNVDRPPDGEARDAVQAIIERFDRMTAENLGADPGEIPVLRFSDEAQDLFDVWRETLELRLRNDSEHAMVEAHLAKFRSLVPSLALLIHLTEASDGPVDRLPLERAIAWAEYLESHARRIYAPAVSPDMDAARALSKRIRQGHAADGFSMRDVYNAGWSGLSTRDNVAAAVAVLIDHDWIRAIEERTPGRTRTIYRINPSVLPPRATA